MAQTIEKIINKNTFKICFTLTFILISALMFAEKSFICDVELYSFATGSFISNFETNDNLFLIFRLNFGSLAAIVAKIIVVITTIAGIAFVWMNKPKISCACVGMLGIVMILSLLRLYDSDINGNGYYIVGGDVDGITYGAATWVKTDALYYFLWAFLIVLIALAILSIKNSKNSSKEVKTNTVIEALPQISPADKIKKYKELLDSGVITQEEFEVKKKSILEE